MELIRGLHNLRPWHRGSVVTLGAFDGVHRGHQAVLHRLLEQSGWLQLPSAVVLFEPLPREYLAPLQAPARLMSFREKVHALRALGIDRVLRIRFDERIRQMEPDEFILRVMVHGLGARFLIAGDDLRFGHNREGGLEMLTSFGERYGFEVRPTHTVSLDGERISSTRLRELLAASDFVAAERMLGRPYGITGRVIKGQQLGRQLGTPTANLQLRRLRAPVRGVFAVEVHGIEARPLPGVANVGVRPTIGDLTQAILEVHILDFDGDLYSRNITVVFRHKIRDERRFDSVAVLREQIQRDLADGRRLLGA
jgi:riboflavin kinase/FMN adenylyltransferase